MENNYKTQIKVGIYLAVGTLCIFTSIFFLGAEKAVFTKFTKIHAHFEQVQGLSEGSIVSLSGVNVGNIKKIDFLPNQNILDVTMSIDENYMSRVRKDSQVEIRTQGALGDKYIFIFSGSADKPQSESGDVLSVASPSDLLGVISQRGGEAGKFFDVVNEFYKMASSINSEGRLGKIMKNVESASTNLANTSRDAQSLMATFSQGKEQNQTGQKFSRSIDKLEAILNKIDKGEGTLGLLINDPSIHNQLKSYLGGSQRKNYLKSLLRTSIEKED
jgi:phospholipid/cholesterol/gamma-HCH transport system substrate-binding protein